MPDTISGDPALHVVSFLAEGGDSIAGNVAGPVNLTGILSKSAHVCAQGHTDIGLRGRAVTSASQLALQTLCTGASVESLLLGLLYSTHWEIYKCI